MASAKLTLARLESRLLVEIDDLDFKLDVAVNLGMFV